MLTGGDNLAPQVQRICDSPHYPIHIKNQNDLTKSRAKSPAKFTMSRAAMVDWKTQPWHQRCNNEPK